MCVVCLAALLIASALSASAPADIVGMSVTARNQVNAGAVQSRSDIAVDPGAEIQFADADHFSWMIPGDFIDYQPCPNPPAPNSIFINLAADHTFNANDVLHLSFELPAPYQFGVAAVTQAMTVNQINGSIANNVLSLDIRDMVEVSQGDFGGAVKVVFAIVPEPASVLLLLAGAAVTAFRRRH